MLHARCLLGVLLVQGMVSAPGSWAAADVRPSVVLIVADDLGGVDLACYGSRFHRTPNLDRLAAAGRRFTRAYAACPVCSPTRAAIMTGKYPARLHLTDWLPGRPDRPDQKLRRPALRQELPLEEVTLAEVLKEAGYATAHMGKWHLGGLGFEPTRQGFDLNIGGDDRGSPPSYFAPFGGKGRALPGLGDAPAGQYLTDRLTTEAERFIAAHRSGPFFLYLPHFAVHTPIQAKADLVGHYAAWDGIPHGRQENPTYAAMIESLDESVGRIVAAIEEAGIADRTVVIFTSDNGGLATREGPLTPATNNAPLRAGKGWLYEGGIRVPLIVRWPGHVPPGVEPDSGLERRPASDHSGPLRSGRSGPSRRREPRQPAHQGDRAVSPGPLLALPALQQPGGPAGRSGARRWVQADRGLRDRPARAVRRARRE